MTTPIHSQILTVLAIYDRMLPRMLSDIVCAHPGCEDGHAVNAAIVLLIGAGQIKVDGAYLCHVEPKTTPDEDLAAYFRAADNYRTQMAKRRGIWSWIGTKLAITWEKLLAAWDRIWPGVVLIIATSFFALGLCAQESHEITIDQITAAACQVESGFVYRGPGKVSGGWRVGDAGETGHWQISPMVLRDLRATTAQAASVVMCESLFRRWYAHLLVATGSHNQALAAYHRGLRGRHRADAKAYAERVMNIASTLSTTN